MKTVSLVAHIKIEHLPFRGAQAIKKHTVSSFSVIRNYKVTYRISALINTISKAVWDKFFGNREPVTDAANLKWRKTILEELKSYIIYKCVEDLLLTYRHDKSKQKKIKPHVSDEIWSVWWIIVNSHTSKDLKFWSKGFPNYCCS